MSDVFGKRLRELREKQGLFQKDIAEIMGMSKQAISRWEKGLDEPNFDMAIRIADYFSVTVDYLIGREG